MALAAGPQVYRPQAYRARKRFPAQSRPPDLALLRRSGLRPANWLPPDNTQLALRVEVAQRTSPTNIGLWLTSALSARDFGYLTADEFC